MNISKYCYIDVSNVTHKLQANLLNSETNPGMLDNLTYTSTGFHTGFSVGGDRTTVLPPPPEGSSIHVHRMQDEGG